MKLTGRMAEVPVGDRMSGRVVNALDNRLTEKKTSKPMPIFPSNAKRSVIMRREVNESLETGIKSIDALFPSEKASES